jgi:hypothetical protein
MDTAEPHTNRPKVRGAYEIHNHIDKVAVWGDSHQ